MTHRTFEVVIPDYNFWRQNIKCQTGCPVDTDSRAYVRAIAAGDYEEAYWIARMPNPFASICGRICAAPCELACRRKDIDAAVSIRALKRFVTQQYGVEVYPDKTGVAESFRERFSRQGSGIMGIAADTDMPVSIVGAGPGGLSCAHDLALMGYRPVVYEKENVAGGMAVMGIPPYRLPREILQAEIDAIIALGVDLRLEVEVGKDLTLDRMMDESAAVLVAAGAGRSITLPIDGADLGGVHGGVDFLKGIYTGSEPSTGPRVVVIGGGNVAYDVARTAIRQESVEAVILVCLEEFHQMLADEVEIVEGEEEGVLRINSYGPHSINADDHGSVRSVTFKRCISLFDYEGRFSPRYDESDTMTIPADTVLFSVGQSFDLAFLEESGLDPNINDRGTIASADDGISTSIPGLFVTGDLAYGPKLVIDAVAGGKKAALAIHEFICGKKTTLGITETHAEEYPGEVSLCEVFHMENYERIPRKHPPTRPPEERSESLDLEVESGFTERSAEEQGGRCLNCAVNTIFDSELCILCGGCAEICPEYCLRLVSLDRIRGDESLTALYVNRYGVDPVGSGSAIIKDEDRCIRCSLCAMKCPTDTITMERFIFREVLADVP
jgi:formate dehydrogenase beta subunit